jgi:hypothetical protein
MCLSCGCNAPRNDHGDSRNLTIVDLRSAADAAGITIDQAATNISAAISKGTSLKSAFDSAYVSCQVVKSSDERRYTLGLAYPSMKPDVSVAADGHRDFVGPDALETTAWEWMTKHRNINLFHKDGTSGHGTVVESYIWRGPDWEIASPVDGQTYSIVKGDWLMGAIWDSYGWALIKNGLVNGWSPEGTARRSEPTAERKASLRS